MSLFSFVLKSTNNIVKLTITHDASFVARILHLFAVKVIESSFVMLTCASAKACGVKFGVFGTLSELYS